MEHWPDDLATTCAWCQRVLTALPPHQICIVGVADTIAVYCSHECKLDEEAHAHLQRQLRTIEHRRQARRGGAA